MDFKAILRTFLKIILPLAFGCLLLWYLYSKMDIGEIWNVIRKGVRYEIILFSLLFGLGANIVRGLRWGLLIRSLGDKVKTCNVIYAVLGNYAVNLVQMCIRDRDYRLWTSLFITHRRRCANCIVVNVVWNFVLKTNVMMIFVVGELGRKQ